MRANKEQSGELAKAQDGSMELSEARTEGNRGREGKDGLTEEVTEHREWKGSTGTSSVGGLRWGPKREGDVSVWMEAICTEVGGWSCTTWECERGGIEMEVMVAPCGN